MKQTVCEENVQPIGVDRIPCTHKSTMGPAPHADLGLQLVCKSVVRTAVLATDMAHMVDSCLIVCDHLLGCDERFHMRQARSDLRLVSSEKDGVDAISMVIAKAEEVLYGLVPKGRVGCQEAKRSMW